jgi:uncharacterized protein
VPAIITCDSGLVIADRVLWAKTPVERARGLIGHPPLCPGEALLIVGGGGQIHTFGLSYSLDVVFLDGGWEILRVLRELRPRRITRWVRRTRYVVEMPAGALPQSIARGSRLSLRAAETGG